MQYFWKHFTSTRTQYQSKSGTFFFFYQYALRLSVLNNELFCQKHLLSGHVGLLCFSPGFSDLSVIGAIMVVVKTVLR